MVFATTNGDEQGNLLGQGSHACGERECVLPGDVAVGKQDVVISQLIGRRGDFRAVLPGTSQGIILDPQVPEIIVAERSKPGDFDGIQVRRSNQDFTQNGGSLSEARWERLGTGDADNKITGRN